VTIIVNITCELAWSIGTHRQSEAVRALHDRLLMVLVANVPPQDLHLFNVWERAVVVPCFDVVYLCVQVLRAFYGPQTGAGPTQYREGIPYSHIIQFPTGLPTH
jgi:hypothetical protein